MRADTGPQTHPDAGTSLSENARPSPPRWRLSTRWEGRRPRRPRFTSRATPGPTRPARPRTLPRMLASCASLLCPLGLWVLGREKTSKDRRRRSDQELRESGMAGSPAPVGAGLKAAPACSPCLPEFQIASLLDQPVSHPGLRLNPISVEPRRRQFRSKMR